ncbi:MAG: gliding motility-associated C-terminal domain-containing protein, partial [Flavobacteriales bacterium]
SISPSMNPACGNEEVVFNADISNGGSSPLINWKVNGSTVQSSNNTSYSSSSLSDNDKISANLITENDSCITPDTVNSNFITMQTKTKSSPTVSISSSDKDICQGDGITFTATPGNANDPVCDWYINGSLAKKGGGMNFSPSLSPGNSKVWCEIRDGVCSDTVRSNEINVSVTQFKPFVNGNLELFVGESVQLVAGGGNSYKWSPAKGLNAVNVPRPRSTPKNTIRYSVEIQNNGCDTTLQVLVRVKKPPVKPHNAITPNGDGVNDTWTIPGISNFPNNEVKIYTRWGQRIFFKENYNNGKGWDGTQNGTILPAGTYYYVINLNREDVKEKFDIVTGYIAIIK